MRPIALPLVVAVFVLAIFSFDARGADASPYDPAALKLNRLAWSLPVDELSKGAGISYAMVDGGELFVLDTNHALHCIDMDKGTHKWIVMLDKKPTYPPGICADAIGICIKDRLVLLKRSNGARILDRTIEYSPCTAPACTKEVVFTGSLYKNRIVSVDPTTTLTGWTFRFQDVITAAPKLYGEGSELYLYAVAHDGTVACFPPNHAHEGGPKKPQWAAKTGDRNTADPVLDGELLFVASQDNSLYAFNRFSGAVKWRFFAGVSLVEPPCIADDKVFLKTIEKIYCIDRNSGKELWSSEDHHEFIGIVGDSAYLWSNDGKVGIFEAASGKLLRELNQTEAVCVISNPEAGTLLFSDGSMIYAYK